MHYLRVWLPPVTPGYGGGGDSSGGDGPRWPVTHQLCQMATFAENRPTIRTRVPLAVDAEVETLRKAMKGLGTDEAAIIKVLTSCSTTQRHIIAEQYKRTHDRDLLKDLKKELSGEFENVVLALMTQPFDFLAKELEHAVDLKNGEAIVQILFTCETPTLRMIREAFRNYDDDTLVEELKDELHKGVFQDVTVATVNGHRSEEYSEEVSKNVAKAIFHGDHEVNDDAVVKAFSALSFKQLQGVFVEYYKLAQRTLGEAFDLKYKGHDKTNMQALFQCLNNRHGYLAASLHKAMAGPGTKDRDLIRLIVSRAEVDLLNIKEEYFQLYNKTLENDIKGDTSGDYKKMLLALLQPNY